MKEQKQQFKFTKYFFLSFILTENSKRSKRSSLPLLRYTNRFPDVPSIWDLTGHSLCCKQASSIYATTETKALDSCQMSISLPKGNSTFYTYLWRSQRITK